MFAKIKREKLPKIEIFERIFEIWSIVRTNDRSHRQNSFISRTRWSWLLNMLYNVYRIALTFFGLWPYQKSIASRVQVALCFVLDFSTIFFQLMRCLTATCDLIFIIEFLSFFLPTMIYSMNYTSFYFNLKAVKRMLEHIRMDWNMHVDSDEIEILIKYAFGGYIFLLALYIIMGLGIAGYISWECSPMILDILIPVNVSRLHTGILIYELFIDEERYLFFYVMYNCLTLAFAVCTFAVINTLHIAFIIHVCAEFKVASVLIHDTISQRTLRIPASQRAYFMYRNIRRAVHIHQRSMKLMNDLMNTFHIWYLCLTLLGVASLSCNLFRFLIGIIELNDIYELYTSLIYFTIFICHIVCIYMACFCGQIITDHSTEISNAIYDTLWYVAPLSIQKLLLFLQISVQDQKLILGGIFVVSFEGFSTLISLSISYFTVIYTMIVKD